MAKENGGGAKPKAMTKSEFFKKIAEDTGLSKGDVLKVYEAMQGLVQRQLGKKGSGVVTLPGMLKLTVARTKADPGGKVVPNPFKPGETMVTKPKPARTKVKARGLKAFLETL